MPSAQPKLPGLDDSPAPVILANAIQVSDGGTEPPVEFRIFAAGEFDTSKGQFLFDDKAAKAVLKSYKTQGIDLVPLDYDHKMLSPFSPSDGGKAAGWFKPVIKNGELWATDVQWTPAAAKALSEREYRFTSPAFFTQSQLNDVTGRARSDKDGHRILELVNVALTNLPATKKQRPLVNNRLETADDPAGAMETPVMKTLLAKFDLPETATELEAVEALAKIRSDHEATRTELGTLLSAVGEETVAAAIGAIEAGKAAVAQNAELSKKLDDIEKARESDERTAIVKQLKDERKLTPAQEKDLVPSLSLEALKAFAKSAPVVTGKSQHTEADPAHGKGAGSSTRLSHEGKTYEQLSGIEKAQLRSSDRETYNALRTDWTNAGKPAAPQS